MSVFVRVPFFIDLIFYFGLFLLQKGISSLKIMLYCKCLFFFVFSQGSAAAASLKDHLTIGQTFLASSVDPRDGSAGWALTSHGVGEKLFTVGRDGEVVGQVAESVQKVDEATWDVTLKPDSQFSDGTPVHAQHVADCLTELNKINSNAQSSLGNMTVTDLDDRTVRIVSDRLTHIMSAVLAEWVFVVYRKNSDGEFVFTGPYAIESFSEDSIDLIPNTFYSRASDRVPIKIIKYADGHELGDSVKNKEIDIGFHLPIDRLPELRNVDGITIKSFEVGYHYMASHNMDTLDDLRVRKAIDLAIDRFALSQSLAGGTGTRSLFPDYSPFFSDTSDPHADTESAKELLSEAGWVLNSSGKLTKNGQELTINLVAYPQRPGLVTMQPVIAEALKGLGMNVFTIVTGEEWGETQQILDSRSFDLMLWAQHTLPRRRSVVVPQHIFPQWWWQQHCQPQLRDS